MKWVGNRALKVRLWGIRTSHPHSHYQEEGWDSWQEDSQEPAQAGVRELEQETRQIQSQGTSGGSIPGLGQEGDPGGAGAGQENKAKTLGSK